jgi:cytochrome c peroxidase
MLSALKGGKLSTVLLVPVIVGLILTGMPTAAKAAGPLPIKTPADARAWGFDSLGNMMSGKMASYPKPHGAHLLLNPRYKVPLPTNLAQFVKNRQAALVLGKALFWDMQVGSDGIQACASCHFQAGGDVRTKNQVATAGDQVKYQRAGALNFDGEDFDIIGFFNAPKTGGTAEPDTFEQIGSRLWEENFQLAGEDFPLVITQNAFDPSSPSFGDIIDADTGALNRNDVVGSMGLMKADFGGVELGSPVDKIKEGTTLGTMRQTTGRNAPPSVNAVFNLYQFWDGRAHPNFNGLNPVGPFDTSNPKYFVNLSGKKKVADRLQERVLKLEMASLASQSTGPPLSDVEMSFAGRTWPDIGKKLLRGPDEKLGGVGALTPLAYQEVAEDDSVLAPYRDSSGKGLKTTYAALIKAAFKDELWNNENQGVALPQQQLVPTTSDEQINIQGPYQIIPLQGTPPRPALPNGFFQMEANFSMFWGIAIMLYEAELVSTKSRFDLWMEGQGTLEEDELFGFTVFVNQGKCIACHSGPEFTNATVRNTQNGLEQIEPVIKRNGDPAFYDNGFYNVGITPTVDDLQRGAPGVGGKPWGNARQFLFQYTGYMDIPFPIIGLPIGNLTEGSCDTPLENGKCTGTFTPGDTNQLFAFATDPTLEPTRGVYFLVCTDMDGDDKCGLGDDIAIKTLDMDGNGKACTVRNIDLNGPYFHNGGAATMQQLLDEYDIGGKFRSHAFLNKVDMLPDMARLGLADVDSEAAGFSPELDAEEALIKFMLTLTDPDVKKEAKPFDHPQLFIPVDGTAPVLNVAAADWNAWLKSQSLPGGVFKELPATDADGGSDLQPFLGLSQFAGNTGKGSIVEVGSD